MGLGPPPCGSLSRKRARPSAVLPNQYHRPTRVRPPTGRSPNLGRPIMSHERLLLCFARAAPRAFPALLAGRTVAPRRRARPRYPRETTVLCPASPPFSSIPRRDANELRRHEAVENLQIRGRCRHHARRLPARRLGRGTPESRRRTRVCSGRELVKVPIRPQSVLPKQAGNCTYVGIL